MSGEGNHQGATPTGPEPSQVDPLRVSPPDGASIPSAFRPKSGVYLGWHNKLCRVYISREATPERDGSVEVWYADGCWTSAFFATFHRWGYQYLGENYAPAPCDEPRDGGDATAAPGRSPAGAVAEAISEGQALDLKSLQDEIQSLRSALQDSERKRVEDIATTREACTSICDARAAYFDRSPGCEAAAASYRATAQEIRALRPATLIAREDANAG